MHPIIRLFAIALIATSMTACESISGSKDVKVVQEPSSITAPSSAVSMQPIMSDADIKRTYNDVLKNNSHGSVQIFSLDDHDMSVPYTGGNAATTRMPTPTPRLPQGVGRQFGGNSHVTVFSLDDNNSPSYANAEGYSPAAPGPDGVSRVYFPHGGKSVNAEGRAVSRHVGQQCRGGGCGVVKVEGHASTRAEAKDEVQRRIINLKISMDRAMNVMRQLIRDGVPAGSIQVTAHGDRVPPVVVPGGDAEAAARRVEIITGSGH